MIRIQLNEETLKAIDVVVTSWGDDYGFDPEIDLLDPPKTPDEGYYRMYANGDEA